MKLKIIHLATSLTLITLFSACSQQQYAFRKKIKVGETVAMQAPDGEEPAESAASDAPAEETFAVSSNPEEMIASPESAMIIAESGAMTTDKGTTLKHERTATAVSYPLSARQEHIRNKIEKKMAATEPDSQMPESRRLVILGLIIMLIGILVGIIIPLGWLVFLVGFVIFILGLIFYLADHL